MAVLKSYVLITNSACLRIVCGENKAGLRAVDWLTGFRFEEGSDVGDGWARKQEGSFCHKHSS